MSSFLLNFILRPTYLYFSILIILTSDYRIILLKNYVKSRLADDACPVVNPRVLLLGLEPVLEINKKSLDLIGKMSKLF